VGLISPQKIVNFNLKIVRKLNYSERMKQYYIARTEQGYHAEALRKSAVVMILLGLIFLWALIKWFSK
jgi:hypothetical protein